MLTKYISLLYGPILDDLDKSIFDLTAFDSMSTSETLMRRRFDLRTFATIILIDFARMNRSNLSLMDAFLDDPICCYTVYFMFKEMDNTFLNLDKIAMQAGCSYRNLSNKYYRCLGVTPKKLLKRLRMMGATMLVELTNNKIEDIPILVGYADSKYFRSEFRLFTGMVPSAYRKKFKKTTDLFNCESL